MTAFASERIMAEIKNYKSPSLSWVLRKLKYIKIRKPIDITIVDVQ